MLPSVIEDWKLDDEVLPDVDEDINEHVVPNQSKTDVVLEGDAGATLIDLEEIKSSMNEEDEEIDDTEPTTENLKRLWFIKQPEKQELTFKADVNISGTKKLKKGIISWFFDS